MTIRDTIEVDAQGFGKIGEAARLADELADSFERAGKKGKKAGEDVEDGVKKSTRAKDRERKATEKLSTQMKREQTLLRQLSTFDGGAEKRIAGLEAELRARKKLARQDVGPPASAARKPSSGLQKGVQSGVFAGSLQAEAAMLGSQILLGAGDAFLEGQKFREDTLRGLEILLKSGDEAKRVWTEASVLARELGQTQKETVSSVQALLAQGFSEGAATDIVKAMADLKAINPQANLEGIVRAIGQIKATGRLQGDELMQLTEAGLAADRVYEQLAKQLGVTKAEIVDLQAAGKISAEETQKAILAAVKQMTGKELGEVAAGGADKLSTQLERLKDAPQRFLGSLDLGGGKQAVELLKNINDLMDPTTEKGARMKQLFEQILIPFVKDSLQVVDGLLAIMGALGMLDQAQQQASTSGAAWRGAIDGAWQALTAIFQPVIWLKDGLVWLAEGFGSSGDAATEASGSITGAFGGLSNVLGSAGSNAATALIDGLTAGLYSQIFRVEAASAAVAAGANKGVIKEAKIASPSKVWHQYGEFMPEGMAGGIAKSAPMAARAAQEAVAAINSAALNGSSATFSQLAAGRQSGGRTLPQMTISPQFNFANVTDPEEAAKRALAAMRPMVEQLLARGGADGAEA